MERVGRSGAIYRVPSRNCKIKIGTAERPDSCRGGDYNLVHCSEVGIWKKTYRTFVFGPRHQSLETFTGGAFTRQGVKSPVNASKSSFVFFQYLVSHVS